MIKAIDTEAKAITTGVSACLEKELSSDGKDDLDIAAMHELDAWTQRAQNLRKDAALLAPVLPAHLKQLEPELRAHADYVQTLQSEVKGRVFARREKAYSAVLAEQHAVVAVPADGNCFFWSAVIARESGDVASSQSAMDDRAARARKLAASDCLSEVHALRSRIGQYMRENISSLKHEMIEACLEALASQSASVLRDNLIEQLGACIRLQTSGSWDGSETTLCACARESLGSATNSAGGDQGALEACQIYCQTFGRPGVFAERLQVQCLSNLWGRTIQLYYYTGGEKTPAKGAAVIPAEVFSPDNASEDSCDVAVSLLHYPSARHYDLVVQLAPAPTRHGTSEVGSSPKVRAFNMSEDRFDSNKPCRNRAEQAKPEVKQRSRKKQGGTRNRTSSPSSVTDSVC
jgi:hypothetical protein